MSILQKPTTKKAFQARWAAIASLSILGFITATNPANAFNVTYNFTVQIDSNAYEAQGLTVGTTEQGSFTYNTDGLATYPNDQLTGTSSEQYVSTSQGNLSLTFNFLNTAYTEKSDLNYGSAFYAPFYYPIAFFTDGKLAGLDFLVVPAKFQPPQNALGFRIYKDAFYAGAIGSAANESGLQVGTVSYVNAATMPEPPPPSAAAAAVPEPSEVGGAIVAFGVFGVWIKTAKRKRQNRE